MNNDFRDIDPFFAVNDCDHGHLSKFGTMSHLFTHKIRERTIECESVIDLATFDISPILIAASSVRVQAAHTWPPASLRQGQIVALGGYPGSFRRERSGEVEWSFASFFAPVAQSSEEHSAFQLNLADSHWPDGSGGIPEHSELGGMSGGPIFRFHSDPVEFLVLAGFLYQASAEFELVRGRHASCISEFGGIAGGA